MAAAWSVSRLLRRKLQYQSPSVADLPSMMKRRSKWAESAGSKSARGLTIIGAGVSGILSLGSIANAEEADHGLACSSYPWPSRGVLSSYDAAFIPSDKQIFKHDCASCHTGLSLHKDRVAKAGNDDGDMAAAEIDVINGQNFESKASLFCPGSPQPHATGKAAKFANTGVGLLSKACVESQNHSFDLFNGGNRRCAGALIRDGLCKNPYLFAGAISMPKMPNSYSIDFEDGNGITLTKAQMRKDVAVLLSKAT